MNEQYILAVDGGATKTVMTIRSSEGRELFSATSTSSNYQAAGIEHVQHVFTGLLRSAAAHLPSLFIDVAVFAISGVDTAQDKKIIEEIIEESIARCPFTFGQVIIENDVEATLKGLGHHDVSLLISGTGAICFSYMNNRIIRAGGWGHRVGDEGSGYWIGKHIAKAIFRAADGRNKPTALTELILAGHQVNSTDELFNLIYSPDYTNARLASFGSYLQQAVDMKDAVAQKIMYKAVDELVLLAATTLRNAGYANEVHTLFLNGGVLKNNPSIMDGIITQLEKTHPNLSVKLCEEKPIESIFNRGLRELNGTLYIN
ncbi:MULTISPECIES: N-acetylglucosamine kinase [Solibacillus]|uniref:N-acetylglucosamine kinase n=1 Tax=Solibacillus merdavium TaxID=2762218 RepID=A0ABR8XQS9_9BACL|nr:BadF/BadG/BcrA/BcrD ATPase family protein [Solibacillus merdavium]MBD8034295.1 N-acetylglucosamine kinase [Solibacillus merdavium]